MKLKRLWIAVLCAACLIGGRNAMAMLPNDVLVTMDGKPAVTTEEIIKERDQDNKTSDVNMITMKDYINYRVIKLVLNDWYNRHKDQVAAVVEKTKKECQKQEADYDQFYFTHLAFLQDSNTETRIKEIAPQFDIVVHEDNVNTLFNPEAQGPMVADIVLVSRNNKPLLTVQNVKDIIDARDKLIADLKKERARFPERDANRLLKSEFYDRLKTIIVPLWAPTIKNDVDYQKSKKVWCENRIKLNKEELFTKEITDRFGGDHDAAMNHYKKEYKIELLENNVNKFLEQFPEEQ